MTHNLSIRSSSLLVLALAATAHAQPGASGPSGPAAPAPTVAAAPPAATGPVAHALVIHVAPASTPVGAPVELEAMIDAPFAETLTARWRAIGDTAWQDVVFERSSAGGWFATLPAARPPGLEYYLRGQDSSGAEVVHFASAEAPHVVRVDPTLFDRLEMLDRARLAGRVDSVAVEVIGHNFGNRYDQPDRFIRGEITYTHALLRQLHHIVFGFGTIAGKTPLYTSDVDHTYEAKGLRYGFGEVRVRAHPSVFFDLRLALGVSQDGFDQAARGQVIFGKPWRSSVAVGGEVIGDLGPSAWVRLQWDTAPPLLMGASITRTDLPGASIGSAGLFIGYDVAYRIENRLTLKGQVSYGSRDGAAHVGGGFGTAIDF